MPYIADGFISANDQDYFNLAGISINDPIIGDGTIQQQVVLLPYIEFWQNLLYLNETFMEAVRERQDSARCRLAGSAVALRNSRSRMSGSMAGVGLGRLGGAGRSTVPIACGADELGTPAQPARANTSSHTAYKIAHKDKMASTIPDGWDTNQQIRDHQLATSIINGHKNGVNDVFGPESLELLARFFVPDPSSLYEQIAKERLDCWSGSEYC